MTFPHDSMRELISDLEKEGELLRVKEEVDWNLEVGAITRRAMELGRVKSVKDGGQPALWFEKIKGYPKGFSILGNVPASLKRVAMIFGHENPDKVTYPEMQDLFMHGLEHPIKPVVVKDGPCKENKAFGDDCNLNMFPAPMIHEGDGGRYICSYHLTITKDRHSDWVNWGMYRLMIHDRRSLGCLMVHGQHGPDMYFQQYEPNNEPMPFAIAITADPLSSLASSAPIPNFVSEADVVGGWRGKPVELVKCETNELYVPASSEIVIEGVVPPKVRAWEGPFGEYTGFRASPRDLRPVFVVRCITWRNDPILAMSNMGWILSESSVTHAIARAAIYKKVFLEQQWPVTAVHVPPECIGDLLVVAVKRGRPRVAQGIMAASLSAPSGIYTSKVIVCDEDMDIFDLATVMINVVEKVHPVRGVTPYFHQGNPLFPFADLKERLEMTGPQLLLDATWPLDWPPEIAVPPKVAFNEVYPKELQGKVLSKWTEYGLK